MNLIRHLCHTFWRKVLSLKTDLRQNFVFCTVLVMDLDVDLSSLEINDQQRKRRYSGRLKYISTLVATNSSSPSSSDNENRSENPNNKNNNNNPAPVVAVRRSSRKKIRKLETIEPRVLSAPKKLSLDSNMKEIENYYLDRRVKRLPPSLETIYEEPQNQTSRGSYMSAKKFRRLINFDESVKNATKIKKRRMKAKAVSSVKRHSFKKVTIDSLLEKLNEIGE